MHRTGETITIKQCTRTARPFSHSRVTHITDIDCTVSSPPLPIYIAQPSVTKFKAAAAARNERLSYHTAASYCKPRDGGFSIILLCTRRSSVSGPEADVEEDEGEGHEEDEAVVDRGDLDLDKK